MAFTTNNTNAPQPKQRHDAPGQPQPHQQRQSRQQSWLVALSALYQHQAFSLSTAIAFFGIADESAGERTELLLLQASSSTSYCAPTTANPVEVHHDAGSNTSACTQEAQHSRQPAFNSLTDDVPLDEAVVALRDRVVGDCPIDPLPLAVVLEYSHPPKRVSSVLVRTPGAWHQAVIHTPSFWEADYGGLNDWVDLEERFPPVILSALAVCPDHREVWIRKFNPAKMTAMTKDVLAAIRRLRVLVFPELQQMLELMPNLNALCIEAPPAPCGGPRRTRDFSFLKTLPCAASLKELWVECIHDLSPLTAFTSLETLRINCRRRLDRGKLEVPLRSIRPLASLTSLRVLRLELSGFHIVPLRALSVLKSLESLHLSGCYWLSGIVGNPPWKSLKVLQCDNCELQRISGLAHLPSLEVVHFRECHKLHDITPLAAVPSLRELTLNDCANITDASPVASLARLEKLVLRGSSAKLKTHPAMGSLSPRTTMVVDHH